ncbi:MAG: LysR family transcriptional regulator [Acidobacteria bacterium]|nr:LysR family transcriptional regulator [Acidobacteriota bacterium]MCW5970140.1 LysR family transcriptional regulator [Blastocatellales bacterium]
MHVETFKTYCDLIETGSFSQAAALNFVTQSAVSQQVRTLERRYGQELVERGRRKGVTPTSAGRILYEACKGMLERLNEVEAQLRVSTTEISGTVRIATVYSVGLHELPPDIKRFIIAHPQVNVRLEYGRADKIYDACLNNTIDFGVVALPLRRSQLEVIPFRSDKLVLVCSLENPLAARRRTSLKALTGKSFIAFERDIPTRLTIDRLLKAHGVAVKVAMEFDNIETIKRSVEAGVGVSILPASAVETERRNRTLAALSFTEGTFTREIGIIHRRGKVFSAAAREFIALLTETRSDDTQQK